MLFQLDFFPANDVNGDVLHSMTSDDDYFENLILRPRLRGLGGGQLVLSRQVGFAAIDSGTLGPEVFVRALIPSVHPTRYLWGFFLDMREQQLVSYDEKGGEVFRASGPGPLFYLHRAILWDHKLSDAGTQWVFDPDNAVIHVPDNATAGRVLNFMRQEDEERPTNFLPDLTWGFDQAEDSAGDNWGSDYEMGADFELPMGENYLELLWQIQEGVDEPLDFTMYLGAVGSPVLRLDAWKSLGRDLTGTAFAEDVVLIKEGENLESELTAAQGRRGKSTHGQSSGTSLRKATHALVHGKDGVWDQAVLPSWDPGEYAKAVLVEYPNSANENVLERAGKRWLRRQANGDNEFDVEIEPGFDPENGKYFPGPGPNLWSASPSDGHFWLGDTVTLRTGDDGGLSSWLDYAYEPEWVTGIDLEFGPDLAAVDDTPEESALSWHVGVLFNVERGSDNSSPNAGGGGGGCSCGAQHHLCRPGEVAEESTFRWYPDNTTPSGTLVDAAATWDEPGSASTGTLRDDPDGDYTAASFVSRSATGLAGGEDHLYVIYARTLTAGEAELVAAGGAILVAQFQGSARFGIGISESSQDMISQIEATVGIGTTGSIRGVALPLHSAASSAGSSKWPASATEANKQFPPAAESGVMDAVPGTVAGDRLYVALGSRNFTTVTSGGAVGINTSEATDLPANDDASVVEGNTWVQIGSGSSALLETVGDGHPLLIGDGQRVKRCSDTEHFFATRAPTASDDFATAGMRYGTHWVWVDNVDEPTESFGSWMLVDPTEGEAVWVQISSGTTGAAHVHEQAEIVSTVIDHEDMGATEDFDSSLGPDHTGELTDDLVVTLSGAVAGEAAWLSLELIDDGSGPYTITWPGTVSWPGGIAPDPPAAGEKLRVALVSYDGGVSWDGSYPGTGTSSASLTVEDDDADVTVADVVTLQFERDHFEVEDLTGGVAKVSLVDPGGSGAGVMPLTAVVDGIPMLVWDENGSLIPVDA